MQFKLATVAALLATVVSPAFAGSEGATVVSAIQKLTERVVDVSKELQELSVVNFPSKGYVGRPSLKFQSLHPPQRYETNIAQKFPSSYRDVLILKNDQVSQAPRGIDASDEPEVCNAFITFAEVEKTFLQDVIGKHGIFGIFVFTSPVGALLRADENISDVCVPNMIPASKKPHSQLADILLQHPWLGSILQERSPG
ncbi:hypothetical protein N7448_003622 [Penicillium atrosanguineum]|uniref:Uncharacterized protein n=1 Tax=Penicillium atrosanguineum TaxID=1132637 RepID=A0A9W9U3Y1_9EURO|nr:hypothetical protein N7448_003622 [Penicillium atrosanguineum]KAJ5315647.1 hypothetical protein N7476_005954 [Penicillium atrosanguineum]